MARFSAYEIASLADHAPACRGTPVVERRACAGDGALTLLRKRCRMPRIAELVLALIVPEPLPRETRREAALCILRLARLLAEAQGKLRELTAAQVPSVGATQDGT